MSVFITGGQAAERVKYAGWIESSGTQWINTGVNPNQDTRVVVDMDITERSAQQSLFGARVSSGSTWFVLYTYPGVSGYEDGYASQVKTPAATNSGRVLIDKNKNVTKINGTAVSQFTYSAFSTPWPIYLFTLNNKGTDFTANCPTYAKLYSCQIYSNDVLVRDFWPCYDPDGVACLYDKVEEKYYYNQGTGEFAAGGKAESGNEPEDPQPETCVVTITGSGVYTQNNRTVGTVTVNGTEYTSATTAVVEKGTSIRLLVIGSISKPYYGTIVVDGTTVRSVADGLSSSYDLVVNSNTKIVMAAYNHGDSRETCYGSITVTTS